MCDAHLIVAQTPHAGPACFYVPRWRPDGTRNGVHLQRLKDKVGNRSNSSSEVELDDAWGVLMGEEGRGIPTIIEMANTTRLSCVIGSAAIVRQATVQAIAYARQRHADEHRAIDAGAPVRAALLAALWHVPEGQPFDAPARAAFLALCHDAVRRHGSIGEPEAIMLPLRFLLELLPPDSADTGLRSAVQALASQLQSSLPGASLGSLSQAPRHNGAHSARPDSPAASS